MPEKHNIIIIIIINTLQRKKLSIDEWSNLVQVT